MTKIAFIDRDGTLNKEINYLHRWEDFEWITGAKESLKELKKIGFLLAIVTNQSGIARGYYKETDLEILQKKMDDDLYQSTGVHIDHFQFCPHHPDYTGACSCRKPELDMFHRVIKLYPDFDKENSFMIGDNISDIEAAYRLGIQSFLVETGHGMAAKKKVNLKKTTLLKSIKELKDLL